MGSSVTSFIRCFADDAMARLGKRVTHCWLPEWKYRGLIAEARGLRPWRDVDEKLLAECEKCVLLQTVHGGIWVEPATHPYPVISWAFAEETGDG